MGRTRFAGKPSSMSRSFGTLAESFEAQARSKRVWLETFSEGRNKRPDHEIEHKREEMECLEEGAQWFRRAAARDKGKAA